MRPSAAEPPVSSPRVSRIVGSIAGAVTLLLVAFASGYGYHRDELYFLAAGRHLDWAYADQGPITPLIARAMSEIAPQSLTVLRLPSALAAGLTVALTGLLARELGGSRRAETIGWPRFVDTIAGVYRSLPNARRVVILTGNYDEAGAIDRYGPALGLPPAYSGHNAYGDWGPPPGHGLSRTGGVVVTAVAAPAPPGLNADGFGDRRPRSACRS